MKMTSKRKESLNRRSDGAFGPWRGGSKKADLPKKQNTFQGIAVHIGKEYKRQHGRVARIGECVRFKTKSGAYHKQAFWYVRAGNGWRKSFTAQNKPNPSEIKLICINSRKGR